MFNSIKEKELSIENNDDFLENFPAAFFTVDLNRNITSWNKLAVDITGYTADEIIGKSCKFLDSDKCMGDCDIFNESVKKPIINKICRIKIKNGSYKYISKNVNIKIDEYGKPLYAIECFHDITERIDTEIELKESEERYSAIVDSAPEIVVIHKMGKILFVNETGVVESGFKREEIVGHSMFDFLTDESKIKVKDAVKDRLKGNVVKDYDIGFVKKNGEVIILIVKTKIINYQNEPVH